MKNTYISFIRKVQIVFICFIFFKTCPSPGQSGCTDKTANNYNSAATVNDGSCTYNPTEYNPPLLVNPINDILKESSGLVWAGNSLWSFNDRNNPPDLYRIDTASNAILQTVRLKGATNVDWEEATFDGTYFYVGDFGNNSYGARTDLKIYKFPFSAIPDYTTNPSATIDSQQIEIIRFTYSNQSQPPDSTVSQNTTKFDCEAMIVDSGKIHLFTKNWVDLTSTHYIINADTAGTYVANPADTLATGYLVTAAAKVPGKNIIVLLGYQPFVPGNHFLHILSDYSNGKYFNGNKRKINLPDAQEMGQSEGIAFRNDHYGYISNEKISIIPQKLHSFDISSFVPSTILANELSNFNVSKINDVNKISWNFSNIIQNLQIQQSADGLHFTVIKSCSGSKEGFFNNKSLHYESYYRLAWKGDNGEDYYSKIIRIQNEKSYLIDHIALKAIGELSFILNGNQSEKMAFQLLTTDGRVLATSDTRSFMPGANKVNFSITPVFGGIVVLTICNNKQKTTNLLHIQK